MLEQFVSKWGAADPATESSVFFVRGDPGYVPWKLFNRSATPGVWADGFLQIATPDLPEVNDALRAWEFAIGPDDGTRQVFLRNGYGDIAFTQVEKGRAAARVLSPRLTKVYDPDMRPDLETTLNFFILGPTDRIPGGPEKHPFLDRDVFDAWVAKNGDLSMNEALVPKLPYSMGGKHEPDNFYVSDLASFYRDTGEIWAKAFNK
jgi:hypothetical protein